jgi:serpin B
MKLPWTFVAALRLGFVTAQAGDAKIASDTVNALGVDLYQPQAAGEANLLFSPYSIQNALAMTYAGAAGRTREEMRLVLRYPKEDTALHESFEALAAAITESVAKSVETVKASSDLGGPRSPIEFHLANRLFARRGQGYLPAFLDRVKKSYGAPLEEMDFGTNPEKARGEINQWIAGQTNNRIRDVLPAGSITPNTSLALANALYLIAPWTKAFKEKTTKPDHFLAHGRDMVDVPTMRDESPMGYSKGDDYEVIARPLAQGDLRFVVFLPNNPDGLAALERKLTPALLAEGANAKAQKFEIYLPKFRLEPASEELGSALQKLGMRSAFDIPPGSADFSGMASSQSSQPIFLGGVNHQAWLAIDEKGVEGAAGTVARMFFRFGGNDPAPREIHVDHPFLFAIVHIPTGACLFLGRVTDPR